MRFRLALEKIKEVICMELQTNIKQCSDSAKQICSSISHPTTQMTKRWLGWLLFCSLFVNKDLLYFGTVSEYLVKISQIITCLSLLAAIVYIRVHNVKINRWIVSTYGLLVVLILFTALINWDIRVGYFILIATYGLCAAMLMICSMDEIYEFLYKAMTLICAASLVMFAIQKTAPQLLEIFPVVRNVSGLPFQFGVLSNAYAEYGTFERNWGPFREPGVFQMFSVVSLMYGLFRRERTGLVSVLLHLLAIVTTFSTTGYIALGLILIAMVTQKKQEMHARNLYGKVFAVSTVGILYLVLFTNVLFSSGEMAYISVFGKLFHQSDSNISMGSRMASIIVNIRMGFEHPLFGGGLSFVDKRFSELCLELYGNSGLHNTNTLMIVLSTFGTAAFILVTAKYCFFFLEYFQGGLCTKLLLLMAFMCLLVGENMIFSFLIMLPVFEVTDMEKRTIMKIKERITLWRKLHR